MLRWNIPQKAYLVFHKYPLCIVVGNEVEGISDELLSLCDVALEIPMFGIKHSLNVAVAYGIVVFHAVMAYQLEHIITE